MHRSLAQAALSFMVSQQVQEVPDAFILLHQPIGILLYATRVGHTGEIEFVHGGLVDRDTVWAKNLPDEEPLYVEEDFVHLGDGESLSSAHADVGASPKNIVPAILYGSFGSKHFASLYRALVKQRIPFVVRHMAVGWEFRGQTQPTVLQGYGVRLDIRNVEYKSFDDHQGHALHDMVPNGGHNSDNYKPSAVSFNQDASDWKEAFTNGIDPTILVEEQKKGASQEIKAFFKDYLPELEESMMEGSNGKIDHVFIPPKSELRQLSIQAAMVISQSKDPLWTLQLLAQNLPSFAVALSNVSVPDDFISRVEHANQIYFSQDKSMRLKGTNDAVMDFRVNGRSIKVDRPSFNLFELINVFREENDLMKSIDDTFGFDLQLKDLVTAFITMGKDSFYERSLEDRNDNEDSVRIDEPKLRIDVGSGYKGAVIYLNDIEKDIEYRDWPKSVERAIYSVQFGGPLVIRRNVFTVLLVLDPLRANQGVLETLSMSIQMIQSGMPLRVGIVFVSDSDIQRCDKNMKHDGTNDGDCLYSNEDTAGIKNKDRNEVTPQTVMKVFQYNVKKYGRNIKLPYFYFLLQELKSEMSVQALADANIRVLEKLGIQANDSLTDVNDAILYEPLTDSNMEETYHKSITFAVRKNIKPGNAFVNGIPFSLDSPRDFEKITLEEMQRILGKMMTGQITDASPRSIYAMLLKGRHVHSSMHPSLLETDPHYIVLSRNYCNRLLMLSDPTSKDAARVVIDVITDFVTNDSLTTLLSFLEAMKTMSTSELDPTAFRVFPSNVESSHSFLGHVFGEAGGFSIDELIDFVKFALSSPELRNCTMNSSRPYYEEVTQSFSARGLSFPHCLLDGDSEYVKIPDKYNSTSIVLVNGRVFIPSDSSVQMKDLHVLLALENDTSKKIAKNVANNFNSHEFSCVVSQVAAYLGNTFYSTEFATNFRSSISDLSDDLRKHMVHFSWNDRDKVCC
jgi:UDP-glucose:glycoprotein glucosyltransferase